ncbi:MAG: type IV secretion system DNA-binding domain-containing protein, partial [Acidobacteria bacterium]|nr:type IV secretion system DNA-binding domain-containing protein [Acidobacteriota bacterium]
MYIIGKTGTGKSTLIANLARQDALNGEGFALLDPHGDLAEQVLRSVPEQRQVDLIYFNVPDTAHPLAFNPLEATQPELRPLVASGLISVFKKIWAEFWGPRLEYILRNSLLALLDVPQSTLLDIPRLLDDPTFRRYVLAHVQDSQVRRFWLREYGNYPVRFRAEAIAPIQNKVGEFLVNPILRRIVGQLKSTLDLRSVMDEGKILLVNLAKGKIGEDTSALLGAMLATKISLAALSRAELPEADRRDFYLYADEFPSFTTTSFAGMLAEMRKYRVGLVLAHQYLTQVDETLRDAILGNVGTMIAFRVGLTDAEILEKEFHPEFRAGDLINLPN